MSDSSNYQEQDLAPELQREHFWHQVVVISAFVFCLCALPALQYWLVGTWPTLTQQPSPESGQVAGVQTEMPTQMSPSSNGVASPSADCIAQKQAQLTKWQQELQEQKQTALAAYEKAILPYQAAQSALVGSPESIKASQAELDDLINDQYRTYFSVVSALESQSVIQQQELMDQPCPTP